MNLKYDFTGSEATKDHWSRVVDQRFQRDWSTKCCQPWADTYLIEKIPRSKATLKQFHNQLNVKSPQEDVLISNQVKSKKKQTRLIQQGSIESWKNTSLRKKRIFAKSCCKLMDRFYPQWRQG